jgi:SNF2 family DNA or RNA helicase
VLSPGVDISYRRSLKSCGAIEKVLVSLGSVVDGSVMFSRWTTMLDLVEIESRRRKVGCSRLDGFMKRANRANTILPIKAGGVGYIRFLIALTLDSI